MEQQFEKFIRDINFLMGKLIPQNWEMVKLEPGKAILNITMYDIEVSDLVFTHTYRFTMNELKQLYAISKYGENVSEKEKVQSIKKATVAAFRKMEKWVNNISQNMTQNDFVLIAVNKIRNDLSDDWTIKPITLDNKVYSEISFTYNKQMVSVEIETDYLRFIRGSKTLSEAIKKIRNEGKKGTMKKVNLSNNDELFISLQNDIEERNKEMPEEKKQHNKERKSGGKRRKKRTNNTSSETDNVNQNLTQKELENLIFGQ